MTARMNTGEAIQEGREIRWSSSGRFEALADLLGPGDRAGGATGSGTSARSWGSGFARLEQDPGKRFAGRGPGLQRKGRGCLPGRPLGRGKGSGRRPDGLRLEVPLRHGQVGLGVGMGPARAPGPAATSRWPPRPCPCRRAAHPPGAAGRGARSTLPPRAGPRRIREPPPPPGRRALRGQTQRLPGVLEVGPCEGVARLLGEDLLPLAHGVLDLTHVEEGAAVPEQPIPVWERGRGWGRGGRPPAGWTAPGTSGRLRGSPWPGYSRDPGPAPGPTWRGHPARVPAS